MQDAGNWGGQTRGPVRKLAFAFGRWNRRRKSRLALRVAREMDARSHLLVGVTGADSSVNNLIERRSSTTLPFVVVRRPRATCVLETTGQQQDR